MYQRIHATQQPINAHLSLPGSKDMTHRALFLASIADGISELHHIREDKGSLSLINILQQAGIVIQYDKKNKICIIAGCQGKLPKKELSFWCEQIEPTTYFLLGLTSITNGVYFFDCPTQLRSLLSYSLLDTLIKQGVQCIPSDTHQMPFTLIGTDTLSGHDVTFSSPLNPQVLSTLLMIAPFARVPFNFSFEHTPQIALVDLTATMMSEFGVLVHRVHQCLYMVPIPQRYHARNYIIEPDMIIASYFFAAAAVTQGSITIQAIKRDQCKQSAVKILSILEKMGCIIIEDKLTFTIKAPEQLNGIELSLRDFSDIFLVIAAIAPFASGTTTLTHIGTCNEEEASLLKNMSNALINLQVNIEVSSDWIKIIPSKPKAAKLDTHHDYRLGMAYAILGLRIPDIIIENADCVDDIYPEFYNIWNQLSITHHEKV